MVKTKGKEIKPESVATTDTDFVLDANIKSHTSNNNVTQSNNFVNSVSMEELKKLPVWICWKYEERGNGDKTKVPYNPRTNGKAQSNNPDTWTTFDFANSKIANYDGVGFMFSDKHFGDLSLCGIDFDNKKNNPNLDKQDLTVKNFMNTYAEITPSGKGKHYIFLCDMSKIPKEIIKENGKEKSKLDSNFYSKNPYNGFEIYFAGITNRYFTFTGDKLDDSLIEERTEQALTFIENYMLKDNFQKKNDPQERKEEKQTYQTSTDILEKARNAKNGAEFSALYDRGNITAYNSDDSAADLALCNRLAFWLQGDFNEIDRYFRQSALYRDKWERTDYRTATINKAIASCRGKFYNPRPPGRPKKEQKYKRQEMPEETLNNIKNNYGNIDDEKLTISGLASHLEEIGITVKYNEITRRDEFGGDISDYKHEHIKNDLPIVVYNELNLIYKKCPKKDVFDFIKRISNRNAYNPVVEMLKNGKWDGTDRLPELYFIICVKPDDTLSQTLIYKWLWQNISMAHNDGGDFGADGLLVLQGEQGIGKTTFARKMALKDNWFADGLHLNFSDKDTTRRATSIWIGELGEISRTFKSDVDALKAFITTPRDVYRLPYGHADEELSRRTSFIGTCNDDKYLIDETGNRRFWTVPVVEIDLDALKNFDAFQLYMQVYEQNAKNNIQGFRLTKDEQKELAKRNGKFEKTINAEMEIRDILLEAKDHDLKQEMTASKFKDSYLLLRNYDVSLIGKALKKIGVEWRDTNKGTLYMLPILPKKDWN
jgi:predicted P-loop ATPase